MLQTFKNAWRTPELRSKLLYVLFILLLYRIGTVIPVPFVDASTFSDYFSGTIFAYMDVLSGGSLSTATLFALGISPYITASIVLQLLTIAIPKLGEIAKDGEHGKEVIDRWTRILTVVLAAVTGFGYYTLLKNNGMLTSVATNGSTGTKVFIGFVIVVCYCAGASLIMWLGEKINENGIGNGISLILFANIISSLPSLVIRLGELIYYSFMGRATGGAKVGYIAGSIGFAVVIIGIMVASTFFVVWVTGSERRIPVQYAKRVVGRKMYGGQNTTLPIKLNMSGVMPIIFASSIVSLPATIMTFAGVTGTSSLQAGKQPTFWNNFYDFMAADGWFYPLIFAVLIIAFSYFYISISFDPVEVSNRLKANGGMIPGIRQGRPTSEFIRKILKKITLIGAIFLTVVAVLPVVLGPHAIEPIVARLLTNAGLVSYTSYFASSFTFGGTSLLIAVGVVLETYRELEAQLTMRNRRGFLG